MKYLIYILILVALPFGLHAQSKAQVTIDYINKYKGIAIKEMKRTGVPASITLAQGIVESGSGESNLAKKANNHFGIKCKTEWTGEKIYQDDDTKNECFRVYPNADSSFVDHSNFLKYRPYYAALFELDPVDDSAWAYGLKKAGYATEKDYPNSLLKVIELYELSQYNFPELVAEDSLEEANVVKEEIKKEPLAKTISTITKDTKNDKDAKDFKELSNSKDTLIKTAAPKDTIVKVITVKDTVYKTIRDTVVKVVTVKDTSSKIKLVEVSKTNSEVKKVTPKPVSINYPKNQKFKINQVSAIWAEAGRSFLEIANTYSVPVYKLYQNNELVETDLVHKDQLLFLNEKKKVSDKKVHVSKDGETFYEIAQMEGIQLAALKSYNSSMTDDGIKEGTILYLFNMPKDPVVPANTEKVKASVIEDKKAGETKTKKQNKFKIF